MDRLIFLSLFLGLVSGRQPIQLQADAGVKSVVVTLGGQEAAKIAGAPWKAIVDFGSELTPRELVAIGYDERGYEIARATQVINLPRPAAELGMTLQRERGETPTHVALTWRHRDAATPRRTSVTLDGKRLRLSAELKAKLPAVKWNVPHVIEAEMHFSDRAVARTQLVTQAGFSDFVGSQMTPVLLRAPGAKEPADVDQCFAIDGTPLDARALEKSNALVLLVKDPNGTTFGEPSAANTILPVIRLDRGTSATTIWPVGRKVVGEMTSDLLDRTLEIDVAKYDFRAVLTRPHIYAPMKDARRVTDAVAVAGLAALRSQRRRAVVLLLSDEPEQSRNDPKAVRRYLESIGVPLFVWSPKGPRPDLADTWGEVIDVSNEVALLRATNKLRATLAEQRIVWVAADPLRALRMTSTGRCELTPVAQHE
jgi:hypothetical protein